MLLRARADLAAWVYLIFSVYEPPVRSDRVVGSPTLLTGIVCRCITGGECALLGAALLVNAREDEGTYMKGGQTFTE